MSKNALLIFCKICYTVLNRRYTLASTKTIAVYLALCLEGLRYDKLEQNSKTIYYRFNHNTLCYWLFTTNNTEGTCERKLDFCKRKHI